MVEKWGIHRFIALCCYAADSGLFCTVLRIISYTPTAHTSKTYMWNPSPKISSSKVNFPFKSVTTSIIRCLTESNLIWKDTLLWYYVHIHIFDHFNIWHFVPTQWLILDSNIFTKYRFPSQSFSPLKRIPISASALVKARLFCWSRRALNKISSKLKTACGWFESHKQHFVLW